MNDPIGKTPSNTGAQVSNRLATKLLVIFFGLGTLLVLSIAFGIGIAYGLEPHESDTDLSNYHWRMRLGVELFYGLLPAGIIIASVCAFYLKHLYQQRAELGDYMPDWRTELVLCWTLLVVGVFLAGASAGYLVTTSFWLAQL